MNNKVTVTEIVGAHAILIANSRAVTADILDIAKDIPMACPNCPFGYSSHNSLY